MPPCLVGGNARSVATANWGTEDRLARSNGDPWKHDEGAEAKETEYATRFAAEVAVGEAYGYSAIHGGRMYPQHWRLSVLDGRALVGEAPATPELLRRLRSGRRG